MLKRIAFAVVAVALLVPALASAGGHATIKVSELPKTIVAGKPVNVLFTIHDAVGHPLSRLKPVVIATRGGRRVQVAARPVKLDGGYRAVVSLPGEGEWTLTVDSGYCGNTCTVRGVQVASR